MTETPVKKYDLKTVKRSGDTTFEFIARKVVVDNINMGNPSTAWTQDALKFYSSIMSRFADDNLANARQSSLTLTEDCLTVIIQYCSQKECLITIMCGQDTIRRDIVEHHETISESDKRSWLFHLKKSLQKMVGIYNESQRLKQEKAAQAEADKAEKRRLKQHHYKK